MASSDVPPLLPSVLDRLIDNEPGVSTEPAWRRSQGVREFRDAVKRDLEALLNTRQVRPDLAQRDEEVSHSMLTYGLPDFTGVGVGSADEREALRRAVETAINRFEPRLRQVNVTIHEPESNFDRKLRMTIEALLWLDPDPEPITFDTVVQPSSSQYEIKSSS